MKHSPYFPLSAYLGLGAARRALLCTLVDPTLSGLILSGPVGTGKSALLRSFGAFVRAHVDPHAPFVQVPIGVTDDRLLGGIDLDRSLASGTRCARTGLIAEADGGYLFADDLALLGDASSASILRALDIGMVRCEREGISRADFSRFVLLGTVVPGERDVEIAVADRVAFLIGEERSLSFDSVRLLLRRIESFERDPMRLAGEYEGAELRLAEQVVTARLLHAMIPVDDASIGALILASDKYNVAGNRAAIFAAKAARAHAALRGSRTIEEEDLRFAVMTVLAPRAENVPDETRRTPEDRPSSPREGSSEGEPPQESDEGNSGNEEGRAEADVDADMDGGEGESGERILDPVDFTLPLPDLGQFFGRDRSRGEGSRGAAAAWTRGRHIRSVEEKPRGRRIAVASTLRAAAPHQRERREEGERRVVLRSEDIRVKRLLRKAGTLFIFCVDASGSMAVNRMREAKGAVARLLQDAYVNRDTVALISFRGKEADLLLPPTSSVERAKRSLDVLPTGGGTPLASVLVKAYALVAASRRRGIEQVLVVLLTDGRGNVPLVENAAGMIMELRRRHVRKEIESVSALFRSGGIRSLVIDTKQTFGANSEAVRLAELLDARYYFLPKIDAGEIVSVVRRSARG